MTAADAAGTDRATLVRQLLALGVEPGGVLLVHSSFRAVRPVSGGPEGLIAALRAALGPQGTLAMPSETGDDDSPFDPASSPADTNLGVVPETFRRLPDVRRSALPVALAAVGPAAAAIVEGPQELPPNGPVSPIGRLHALDAQVLLLGCGHDANTMLHLAELLAGVPYRRPKHFTVLEAGRPKRVDYGENDHCCQRFELADGWLREAGLQAEGAVSRARARLFRARDAVRLARARLEVEPLLFLHPPQAGCAECDDARASLSA